jgi:hypothetical protein
MSALYKQIYFKRARQYLPSAAGAGVSGEIHAEEAVRTAEYGSGSGMGRRDASNFKCL